MQSLLQYIDYTKITELTNPDAIRYVDLTKCVNLRYFRCPSWFTDDDMKKIRKVDLLELYDNKLVTEAGIAHLHVGCSRFRYGHFGKTYVYNNLASKVAQMSTVGQVMPRPELSPEIKINIEELINERLSIPPTPNDKSFKQVEELINERLSIPPTPNDKSFKQVEGFMKLKFTEIMNKMDQIIGGDDLPRELGYPLACNFLETRVHYSDLMRESMREIACSYMTERQEFVLSTNNLYNKFITAINELNSHNKILRVEHFVNFDEALYIVIDFFTDVFGKMGYSPNKTTKFNPEVTIFTCDFSAKCK